MLKYALGVNFSLKRYIKLAIMIWNEWKEKWEWTARAINSFGGKVYRCNIGPPADPSHIQLIEKKLKKELPSQFKEVLQGFSGSVNFGYSIRWKDLFSGANLTEQQQNNFF